MEILFSKLLLCLTLQENSYKNDLYDVFRCSKCFSAQTFNPSKSMNTKNSTFTLIANQMIEEAFDRFKVEWSFLSIEKKSKGLS